MLTAGGLIALAGLRGTDLRLRRGQLLAAGAGRADNLALILSANLRETFASADASLRQLALHSRRVGGPAAPPSSWTSVLSSARAGLTGIGAMTVTDANGIVRHSTQPLIVGQSRSDQFLFRRLSTDTTDALVANTPFRSLTGSGEFFIPLGRRLTRADGTFDGIVVASFGPAALRRVFQAAEVGRQGSVWVLHPDGLVLIREPSDTNPIGEATAGNPIFDTARRVTGSGIRHARVTRDSRVLSTAFRRLEDPPLIVAVALSEGEILADWRREVVISAAVFALLGVALTAILGVLFRQMDIRVAAEAALVRAQRLESLGQLTGGVAHDFNNLLAVILGHASLLAEQVTGEAAREVEQIEKAATRAADLTRGLLAFARRQRLEPKVVDLNPLVEGLRPLVARVLGEDVTLTVRLSSTPCLASLDATQMETALINLCVNARDAMPQGGILVIETGRATLDAGYARLHAEVTPGRYVLVTVSDTGQGIPKEHLQRVFDPFFTTKELGRGTGLGLSMVYGFVKQSGGHAKVYSELGQGTAIKLYFPEAAGPVTAVPAAPESRDESGAGEVVLVVEDDEQLRSLARRSLEALGYRVIAAADGPAALAAARAQGRIDLLLTDVMLPGGMNGRQVAEALSAEHSGLPVVYVSGYSEEILLKRAQVDSTLRLLTKPYDQRQLAAAVRAALSERSQP